MSEPSTRVLIVGGGTAGWLSAAIIASTHKKADGSGVQVSLVESADIPTIGVGEGTWPTMKSTIRDLGIQERDFFRQCHAAFKQGGKFVNWVRGNSDWYYHPFTVPLGYGRIDLAPYVDDIAQYATDTNFQQHVCEAGLAPRTLAEGDYEGQCNYAYHLDAGKFADYLKVFCRDDLGVDHVIGTVSATKLTDDGAIDYVELEDGRELEADLFVDCTGFRSLLLGDALGVDFRSVDDVLFNDRALALQVPYASADSPVATHTIATAQNAGWIWDIGLTHRRGVGHVYSSRFLSDDEAAQNLRHYVGVENNDLEPRLIKFSSGYRDQFWQKNCVAIGLSAGFVEPLEATAIMLVEIAAHYVARNLSPHQEVMAIMGRRFNEQMHYRWQRIVDFLKLHYALTQRPEPYWQAHADRATWPESLREDMAVWRSRGPVREDFDSSVELFPAASYQYVLYGMGFRPDFSDQAYLYNDQSQADRIISRNQQLTQQMLKSLPPHRQYIERWLASEGIKHG